MKTSSYRLCTLLVLLFGFFLSGCYNWPVRNRGNITRESVFDKMPMQESFKRATRKDPEIAVQAMREIDNALKDRDVTMNKLDQPLWFLLKDTVTLNKIKLYAFVLYSNYSARSASSLAELFSHIRNEAEASVKVANGEVISGKLGRWAQRAVTRSLRPELSNIYGEGISSSELEEMPLKEHEDILKDWFRPNLSFLHYTKADDGLIVDEKEKRRVMRRKREREEDDRRAMNRDYTRGTGASNR